MAAIRLQFPGKEQVSVIALSGKHITIGRAATNALQILNRTISLHHAALIEEDDYYRLLDLGSRNGLFVNGDRVSDCPLRERCSLTFGTFECEYLPELTQDLNSSIESLPTQAEIHKLEKENAELKIELRALREGYGVGNPIPLTNAHATMAADSDHEKIWVHAEIEALKAELRQRDRDAVELRAEIAALESDRRDLQCSLNAQGVAFEALPKQAEFEKLQEENARLKRTAAKKIDDLNVLRATVVSDAATIQELRTQVQHAADLLREAEAELSRLNAEHSALSAEYEASKSASTQERVGLEHRKAAEISGLGTKISSLTTKVEGLTAENELLKAQLAEVSSKLSAACADARSTADSADVHYNAQQEKYTIELKRVLHQNATLHGQLEESRRKVATLENQIANLHAYESSSSTTGANRNDSGPMGKEQPARRKKRGSTGEPLENALGRLGYIVRPVRRELIPPPIPFDESERESRVSGTSVVKGENSIGEEI